MDFKLWLENEQIMQMKFGIMVLDPELDDHGNPTVLHFCGYESPPTPECFTDLKRELKENPEFGLTNRNDLIFAEAPQELVQYFNDQIENDQIKIGNLP